MSKTSGSIGAGSAALAELPAGDAAGPAEPRESPVVVADQFHPIF